MTRTQLLAAGLSPEAIRHRVAIGRLHPLSQGVYAVGRPQVSREGRWMAAVLACGPSAALSHASAAALWGIRLDGGGRPVHVSVPAGVRRARPGILVHRKARAVGDCTKHRGIPVTTPARTLLDQATLLDVRQLEADIAAADIHGLVTPEQLRRAAHGFRDLPGVPALRAVIDPHIFTLTDSELERRFLRLVRRIGLPDPLTRQQVNGYRVDFYWPGLGLVVETDGLRYHRTAAQQTRDRLRDQTHLVAGFAPLRFTHWQVAHAAGWVETSLRKVARRQAMFRDS